VVHINCIPNTINGVPFYITLIAPNYWRYYQLMMVINYNLSYAVLLNCIATTFIDCVKIVYQTGNSSSTPSLSKRRGLKQPISKVPLFLREGFRVSSLLVIE